MEPWKARLIVRPFVVGKFEQQSVSRSMAGKWILPGSVWLIRRQPSAGRLLNSLCWGAFLVLFCREVWVFYDSLGWQRADPVLLAGPGVPVALSCLFAHLLSRGPAR